MSKASPRIAAIFSFTLLLLTAAGGSTDSSPIYPAWKEMKADEKLSFVGGYLIGHKDAKELAQIAVEYAGGTSKNLSQDLSKLKSFYRLSSLPPAILVPEIDSFFEDPANRDKSLRQAILHIERERRKQISRSQKS